PGLLRRTPGRRIRAGRPAPARVRRCGAACAPSLGVFEAEADLQADLEVGHLPVLDLAAYFGNLEPVEVAQGLRGPADAVADGLVDALRRGADDLGHPVRAIRHLQILLTPRPWSHGPSVRPGALSPPARPRSNVGFMRSWRRKQAVHTVTDAKPSLSSDIRHRERSYLIKMGIRTICLI